MNDTTPTHTTATHKALLQAIYDDLARGDGRRLVDAMDEDFTWTIAGESAWSRTWRGKQAVRRELLGPLMARFTGGYTAQASRILADGEHVVVQSRGRAETRAGGRYDNHYCMVFRVADGRLREVTEYMDTDLCLRALGMPGTDTPPKPLRGSPLSGAFGLEGGAPSGLAEPVPRVP